MKNIRSLVMTVLSLLVTLSMSVTAEASAKFPGQSSDFPTILHHVMPSVVNISAQGETTVPQELVNDPQPQQANPHQPQENPHPNQPRQFESLGSGVIVDAAKGYVITNAHVVNDAKTITVTLNDGRKFKAKLVGTDPLSDIAVVQIKADHLTDATIGNSDDLRVGDFVATIGSPYGLNQTVTSGIVSGLQRTELGIEGYESFIQTDASINFGNSGGALINQRGQLVGINTAILSPDGGNIGIGFAIPVNMARSVMVQLVQYGAVRRGLMGVIAQDLTPDLADAFHAPGVEGAAVSFITPNSPAEKAGLKSYDIIQELNGKKIKSASDVRNQVGLLRFGATIQLKILRDGKPIVLSLITTDPTQYQQSNIANNPFLHGTELRSFDEILPMQGHIRGVIVIHSKQDSAAWRAGIRRGDVIVSANHMPVTTLDQIVEAAKRDKQQLLVNILRGNAALFVVIK